MTISLIAALDRNRVIGRDNKLPWHLPNDLKHFQELTYGKPVIMGRKTYESIGRPLPDRTNIIVTHDPDYRADGCIVVHSPADALQSAGSAPEIMVVGGEAIFREFLPLADRMYLTYIDASVGGDTYFPEFPKDEWREISREEHPADKENEYAYTFVTLVPRKDHTWNIMAQQRVHKTSTYLSHKQAWK